MIDKYNKIWLNYIMGLALQAIYPEVYPVAYEFFKKGMERHEIAGKIFLEFGESYNVPKIELNTAMIDLSISCAENDYIKNLEQGTSGRMIEDKWISKIFEGK
jgi:hypothetical protein